MGLGVRKWAWNWLFVDLLGKGECFLHFVSIFIDDEFGTKSQSNLNFLILRLLTLLHLEYKKDFDRHHLSITEIPNGTQVSMTVIDLHIPVACHPYLGTTTPNGSVLPRASGFFSITETKMT